MAEAGGGRPRPGTEGLAFGDGLRPGSIRGLPCRRRRGWALFKGQRDSTKGGRDRDFALLKDLVKGPD